MPAIAWNSMCDALFAVLLNRNRALSPFAESTRTGIGQTSAILAWGTQCTLLSRNLLGFECRPLLLAAVAPQSIPKCELYHREYRD